MFRNSRKAVCVGVLGTAALLANVSTAARDSSPVYEQQPNVYATKVRFDDLNLERPAGAETLYERLQSAARRVCNSTDDSSVYLLAGQDRRACHSDALQRAVEGVDSPNLTALHTRRMMYSEPASKEIAAIPR